MQNRNFPTVFDLIVSIGAGLAVGFAITGTRLIIPNNMNKTYPGISNFGEKFIP